MFPQKSKRPRNRSSLGLLQLTNVRQGGITLKSSRAYCLWLTVGSALENSEFVLADAETHSFERVYYTALQVVETLQSVQLALRVLQQYAPHARKLWHCHASRVNCTGIVALPRISRGEGTEGAQARYTSES